MDSRRYGITVESHIIVWFMAIIWHTALFSTVQLFFLSTMPRGVVFPNNISNIKPNPNNILILWLRYFIKKILFNNISNIQQHLGLPSDFHIVAWLCHYAILWFNNRPTQESSVIYTPSTLISWFNKLQSFEILTHYSPYQDFQAIHNNVTTSFSPPPWTSRGLVMVRVILFAEP